jgi:hypothetical protein
VKVPEVEPAATVTLAGTVATEVLLLARVTDVPPVGAGPPRVTVPVAVPLEAMEFGDTVSAVSAAGLTVRFVLTVVEPRVAEICAVVAVPTAVVETVKVPVLEPAATVTDAGTVAAAFPLARVTVVPPVGA